MELPPIPSWDGLHPLIVHFPVALLLVAPLFVVLGVIFRDKGRVFLTSALLLMVLGTIAAFVAVGSGEAAGELADRTPEINAVLQHHLKLAETSRLIFTILTVIFAVILYGPTLLKKELKRPVALALYGCFLVLYAGGSLVLSNTAHNGGRLVHEFGVKAIMDPAPLPGQAMGKPLDADDRVRDGQGVHQDTEAKED